MLAAPNIRRSGKKHGKHVTSSSSIGSRSVQAGTQATVPVIAAGAPGRMANCGDDTSPGLSTGKIRRALARLNILPFTTNRYCITLVC